MSNPSEYEIFKSLEGDAFLVSFEKADDAYNFVKTLGQDIEKYNANPEVKKRIFRIGAATGNVYFERSAYEKNSSKIISDLVMRRVARLRDGAQPGYFYVDQATFNGFTDDVKKNFSEVSVRTKAHETDIYAWRYQLISDISTSTNESSSIICENEALSAEEKSKLLIEIYDWLNNRGTPEIVRIAQIMGMPNNEIPVQYIEPSIVANALVRWAQTNNKLIRLKNLIQNIDSGNR